MPPLLSAACPIAGLFTRAARAAHGSRRRWRRRSPGGRCSPAAAARLTKRRPRCRRCTPIVHGPESMFTAGRRADAATRSATLDELQQPRGRSVHIYMHWADIAPDPTSRHRPSSMPPTRPPTRRAGWAAYDTVIRDAQARGMGVDLGARATRPAVGCRSRGAPSRAPARVAPVGADVRPVRPRGRNPLQRPLHPAREHHSRCRGSSSGRSGTSPTSAPSWLPRPSRHSQVEVVAGALPGAGRRRLDGASRHRSRSGHDPDRRDRPRWGDRRERAGPVSGDGAAALPARPVLRRRRLSAAARAPRRRERGCPATAAGVAAFAAAHPGLFHAIGLRRSPLSPGSAAQQAHPATSPITPSWPRSASSSQTLDTLQRVYGSHTGFPIWSTEFGYQTTPPDTEGGHGQPGHGRPAT